MGKHTGGSLLRTSGGTTDATVTKTLIDCSVVPSAVPSYFS